MNKVKIIKYLALAFTVVGTIGSAWAGSQENKQVLQELVDKHFQNK